MNEIDFRVIEAYLNNSWSQRDIQEEILGINAPTRGGGYKAMEILHRYGISKEYKGVLANQNLDRQLFEESRTIDEYLRRVWQTLKERGGNKKDSK